MAHNIASAIYATSEGIGWHGLGAAIPEDAAKDPARLAKLLGADYAVTPKPIYYLSDDGGYMPVSNSVAQVRSDNGEALSVTSANRYHTDFRQPADMLEAFRDELAKESLHISHAALLKGGKIMAVSAMLDRSHDVYVNDNLSDKVKFFLTLSTGYDKMHGTQRMLSSIRVVCSNTLAAAQQDATANGRLRSIKASQRFGETTLTDLLAGMMGTIQANKRTFDALANAKMTDEQVARYFADVLEINIEDLNRTDRNGKALVATKSQNMLYALMAAYTQAPGQALSTAKGTAFGALNAVTHYATHTKTVRDTDGSGTEQARIASNLFGDAGRLKARALELVNQLVAA
jgi:phage/plasmid-like protein (TIGR03299 family)